MDCMCWALLAGLVFLPAIGLPACGGGGNASAPATAEAGVDSAVPNDSSTAEASTSEASVDAGMTTLALPQFVHGAARVDTTAFPTIPIVVTATGAAPTTVQIAIDTAAPVDATASSATSFAAAMSVAPLSSGVHSVTATALGPGGMKTGTATASLTVATGSLQFTSFATDGPAYSSQIVAAPSGDRLAFTWVDVANGSTHQLYLNYLDGAGARLMATDVVINDPADEPVTGYTAVTSAGIGVVYNVSDAASGHWRVHMRVVDATGTQLVPTMDLTQGEAAFALAAAGADPGGYSAAWLHISPPEDGGALPPVEVRFARWDTASGKLVGPIVLDSDQPQAQGSTQGPQQLEPQAEMGIACNTTLCLVLYSRDVYNSLVELNIPKLFLATVSLSTGQLVGAPQPVEVSDWDTQMFGQQIVALADGTFVLAYTADDTAAELNPITACDMTIERDLLYTVQLDATGTLQGSPQPVFNYQGSREYPRIGSHPDGWALFWEDQRSECDATGAHIGMALNVAAPDRLSLLDPYLEAPGSIGLPPEDPSLAVVGTNFVAAWSDNRDGVGLAQSEPELFLETYWRQ
jgi:hypothetical protein